MGPVKSVLMAPTSERAPPGLDAWAAACASAMAAGERLLTLFGRPDGADGVLTTAVMLDSEGGESRLKLLRGRGRRGDTFASLTAAHPAAQMFERELWEQTGLQPAGHPWLKPVRFEGQRQQHMTDYPFFSVRGQEVHEVGVGPIHASVIEPGHFRFMCHGEQVHHLEIQLGYQHRGVEALLLQRPPLGLSSRVESIAGDSSIAYVWGYCAAVEALAGVQVSLDSDRVRGVALELERVAMHLAGLTGMATDIAFLQGGATYGRLRTAIINATMRVVNDLMRGARSVQSRLQGVGTVSLQAAQDLGLVGLPARASGVAFDTRASLPGRLYTAHPVSLRIEAGGDCWARLTLRMREIDESVRWLREVLEAPGADLAPAGIAALGNLGPETLCVSVCEGFRGPVVQTLETAADGRLLHYKVQDPSLLNWFGVALAVRNNEISDFPICNKSFDLSYCGNDL